MSSILATTKSSWRSRKQQCSKFGVQNWFIHDWIFYKNCYCFCDIAIENFIGYADICHCSVPWNYSTQVRGHSTTMWNKFPQFWPPTLEYLIMSQYGISIILPKLTNAQCAIIRYTRKPPWTGQFWVFYIITNLCHVTKVGLSTNHLITSPCPHSYWMTPYVMCNSGIQSSCLLKLWYDT